jgi:hypothetical protein
MSFQGFEFTYTKPQVPVQNVSETPTQPKVGISLDDMISAEKTSRTDRHRNSGKNRASKDDYKKIVNVYLPRDVLVRLCDGLGIDIKGYHVQLQAILT